MFDKEICKKIDELNEIYILPDGVVGCKYELCIDNEKYHILFENILLNLLKKLGYKKTVEMFKKARKHFWYS